MKKFMIIAVLLVGAWIGHRTELDLGICLNMNGDGKLYNGEPYYNYIKYPENVFPGDLVLTFDILNPLNNYCDDIIYRTDFVINEW